MQLDATRQPQKAQGATDRGSADSRPQWLRQLARLPQYAKTSDLREAWISLLSEFKWDLFGSLTFRDDTHPEAAHKLFRMFISQINRMLYGPRWAKHGKGIVWCVAMERQIRGVIHFHCLLADPELERLLKASWFKQGSRWANRLNEMWNELAGFARIEPIKASELVQRYVSKYVVKGGEIDLGGPLMQQRLSLGAKGRIVKPGATVRASEAPQGSGLNETSASVPGFPGAEGKRGQRVVNLSALASPSPSFEAGRTSRSDLAEGAHVHGVAGGSGSLPERGSATES